MDRQTTDRKTYSFLDYLGDLGGLTEILKLSVGWIMAKLSSLRINAILTNRLYHISSDSETKALIERMKEASKVTGFCEKDQTKSSTIEHLAPGKLSKRASGDI